MAVIEGKMPFQGYETYYRIVGEPSDKPPLLLLHGGPGSSHNYFELLDDFAATSGRQLIMYDQLGCGLSSIPADPKWYVKETWLAELQALIEYLGLQRVHLAGQSWGGMLIMYYLTQSQHPTVVSAMLNSSPSSMPLWAAEQHRLLRYLSAADQAALAQAEASGDFSGEAYEQANANYMSLYCWDEPTADSPEPLRRPRNGEKASRIAEGPNEFVQNGTLADFDVTADLHRVDVPTLVTSGTDDLQTPLLAKTVADRIPGARWELFANSRHLALLDQPEAFRRVLEEWLVANDPR